MGDTVATNARERRGAGRYGSKMPGHFARDMWASLLGDHESCRLLIADICDELGAMKLRQLESRLLPPRGGRLQS